MMKKILIPIGALLIMSLAHTQNLQTSTENYIETRTYLEPSASSLIGKQIYTIKYFEGLGRDVITPIITFEYNKN